MLQVELRCLKKFVTLVGVALLWAQPSATYPQEQPKAEKQPFWYESITVNGFVSAAYSYNFNNPDTMKNFYHVFDFDENSIKIDVLEVSVKKDAIRLGDAGFRFDLTAGSSIPRITHSVGLDIGDLDFHQMFVSYLVPVGHGVKLNFGKFITSMEYEVIEGYDGYNDNYTRSFLFGFAIPFTHTGLKAAYSFNENLSSMLMVVNGWDNAIDNNKSKSVCAQIGIVPVHGMNIYANYMMGPEKTNNNSDIRHVLDVVCTYTLNETITLGLNGDYGTEEHSALNGGAAAWGGIAGYVRFNASKDFSLALRGELFEDKDGIRTGVAQNLQEVTLTPEYRPAEHLVVRGDARLDKSNEPVFQTRSTWKDSQMTLSLNILYIF